MIICHCRGLTDRDIQAAANAGDAQVQDMLSGRGGHSCCGSCTHMVQGMLARNLEPDTATE